MKDFLDTCIIIGYANAGLGEMSLDKNSKSCLEFVKNKKNDFVICYFTLEKDLVSLKRRFNILIDEAKKQNPNFIRLADNHLIFKKDILRGEKFLKVKEVIVERKEDPNLFLDKIRDLVNYRIDFFIQKFIDWIVISLKDIDFDLKSSLFTWTENNSDSNILASAVQFHQQEEITLITLDRKDWTKENLENSISLHPTLRLKYTKIPKIVYP